MKKRVLIYRSLPEDQLDRIRCDYDVVEANPRVESERQAFLDALPTVHGMIGSSYPITESILAKAPQLEVVSSISVGVDKFELDALARRDIVLCHTPGVLTETVADLLFALILGTSRRLLELARYVQEGQWTESVGDDLFGWDVHGKTVGIVGYGRIGQALARRAALGFGMPVLYYARHPGHTGLPEGAARAVSLDELLSKSDFVVLVLPLTPETQGLMGPDQFAKMKPGSVLINGARGPIVQEDALLQALDSGHLRAAGLDVFDVEPLPLESPLRLHPKVLSLPHVGSATHETREAMAAMAVDNLLAVLKGEEPPAAYRL